VIDGEAVVIDLVKGFSLGLNPTGSLVWDLLADHDEPAIAGEVARRFDVTPEAARRDVHEFLAVMRERGLVTEAE
jgi:predicted deacylase